MMKTSPPGVFVNLAISDENAETGGWFRPRFISARFSASKPTVRFDTRR
jgi:hypothetical protein